MRFFRSKAAALRASKKINTNPKALRIGRDVKTGQDLWAGIGEVVLLRDGSHEVAVHGTAGLHKWLGGASAQALLAERGE